MVILLRLSSNNMKSLVIDLEGLKSQIRDRKSSQDGELE